MAKKKKGFWFSRRKKLTKAEKKQRTVAFKRTFMLFVLILVLVAVVVGFIFIDRYVRRNTAQSPDLIKLVDFPSWGSASLRDKIISAASAACGNLKVSENVAMAVGETLTSFSWLDDVRVRLLGESIVIEADYRMPVAVVSSADGDYLISEDLVILDYIDTSSLPIVRILGAPSYQLSWRSVGTNWNADEVVAAVELIGLLSGMDGRLCAEKPLLGELASIDVSNYNGRRSGSEPHIVLYAADGTEIRWGARIGTWQRNLEPKDAEKLTLLYNTYTELGTICLKSAQMGSFIDLTRPQSLTLPTDKY